jgi:hypothetical protein
MVIDAMDLLYTGKYDIFVLISSDSDFTSLVLRLRSSDIYVYGIGKKQTPISFRNACDNFIFTENLSPLEDKSIESENSSKTKKEPKNETKQDIEAIISLLNIACETYGDEDGWTNVSPAGAYIKRSMPDFNPKNFGYSKLSELIANFNTLFDMKKNKGTGIVYKRHE